jgi:hypothetical protein
MKTGKSYILTGLYNGQPYNALNDLTIDRPMPVCSHPPSARESLDPRPVLLRWLP